MMSLPLLQILHWSFYLMRPSHWIKAMFRKKFKQEDFSPNEEYRKSMFHRISLLYVGIVWTGIGALLIMTVNPNIKKEKKEAPEGDELPNQAELNRGGALWWLNSLKSPEEMMNTPGVKVVKLSGLSYTGTEDVTVKMKEIAQERTRKIRDLSGNSVSNDFYLRHYQKIPLEQNGGPSNQELRDQFARDGRDFELELDFANRLFHMKTYYNDDGSVGAFIIEDPNNADDNTHVQDVDIALENKQ